MKKLSIILIAILLLLNIQVSAETYDSITITNPDGAIVLDVYKEYEVKPKTPPVAFLPAGTKLTNVSTECQNKIGFEKYVTGYAEDGYEYYVKPEDTSLENVYPPFDDTSTNDSRVVVGGVEINSTKDTEEKDEPLIWPWIVLIIVAIIGFGILSAYLKQPQCPKCKSRGSREVKRQFLNSEKVLFKEEERIKEYANKGKSRSNTMHKAASNQYVNPPQKIIVKEKLVEGTREYYNVTYQCNKCGEQFTRKEYVDRKQKIV